MRHKHILAIALLVFAAVCAGCSAPTIAAPPSAPAASGDQAIASAFATQQSGVQVSGTGVVTRVLADDNDGGRHQRFIVRLASGQTLLVVHNIDIAPRVPSLAPGVSVAFLGEYVWNSQGGLIHWTHHDPGGQHVAGWLKVDGVTYQ